MTATELSAHSSFRVWMEGQHPKPKRRWHPGRFKSRQLARAFCRNHASVGVWWIAHPNGTDEKYV